jgi:hypothetical protein
MSTCPTCASPDPRKHPAMQADGGEVQPCRDRFHEPKTPELDKQRQAIADGAPHRIGEFLDWLREQGVRLARYDDGVDGLLYESYEPPEKLIAGFYGIDLGKVEAERQALLEYIRAQQGCGS